MFVLLAITVALHLRENGLRVPLFGFYLQAEIKVCIWDVTVA